MGVVPSTLLPESRVSESSGLGREKGSSGLHVPVDVCLGGSVPTSGGRVPLGGPVRNSRDVCVLESRRQRLDFRLRIGPTSSIDLSVSCT